MRCNILVIGWILAFAMFSPMFSVPPIEHILKEVLLLTHTQASLLFTAPILMTVALAIPAGLITDKIGVRKATGIGVVLLAVGAILRGTAGNATSLLVFTFIYGAGFGWCYPNLAKLITTWIPQQRSGMAMGILSTGILTGAALALAITVPIIFPIANNFQGVFLIWGIPPIIAAVAWWVMVKEPSYCGINDQPVHKKTTSVSLIIQNKHLRLLTIMFLLHNFFFYMWSGWTPTLLMLKEASASLAGLIASIALWVSIPTCFLMPRVAYYMGLRKPFILIPAIILALSAFGARTMSLDMSWVIMVLVGVAVHTQFPIILAMPMEMIEKEQVGTASGLLLSIGYIGGVIGPLVGGRILDVTGNLNLSLLILIGVAIAMIIVALFLPETGPLRSFRNYVHQRRRRGAP